MKYKEIVEHYESCFEKHGDNHRGMDWPKLEDVDTRYQVMLDLIYFNKDSSANVSLLDFGCGTAHLLDYMVKAGNVKCKYSGLDLSSKFVDLAKDKHPDVSFYCGDILDPGFELPAHDYIVMNGVFTEKRNLSFEEMWSYFTSMIDALTPKYNKGLAFNVMSKNVDWERDDLFHLSLDKLTAYLCKNITRNFVVRNDYGLYEYTVYLYKK
ncbi:MAG: class I SAM-dependent methyltransferase [Chitinophagaceae bacterium]|nr:class I SAM-dependent methyltransferase [Chitinophagaceae bacterium]